MLAVLTLVASGAVHEMDHADERGSEALQTLEARAAGAAVSPVVASLGGKAGHPAPMHGCSVHCAAHVADQAPILVAFAAPRSLDAAWRIDPRAMPPRHPSFGPDRPPRA